MGERTEQQPMTAGRELNEHVHRDVMGRRLFSQAEMRAEAEVVWREQPQCQYFGSRFVAVPKPNTPEGQGFAHGWADFKQNIPDYSGNISSAWLVVEKMRELGWSFGVHNEIIAPTWTAHFGHPERQDAYAAWSSDSAPLAICLAALEALSSHQEEAP